MSSRALSKIVFQTAAPAAARAWPRMDVAGFVGFAAAGPLDTPVQIENTGEFAKVFGGEEIGSGPSRRRSYLAAAVRAFFHNGGRRCYVVRVAAGEAFDPWAFVDRRFVGQPPAAMASALEGLAARHDGAVEAAPLRGAHALLGEDEVTFLALPDLGQTPSLPSGAEPQELDIETKPAEPVFGPCIEPPVEWQPSTVARGIAWTEVAGARYRLQHFGAENPSGDWRANLPKSASAPVGDWVTVTPSYLLDEAAWIGWFRVRAEFEDHVGRWSAWRSLAVPAASVTAASMQLDAVIQVQLEVLRMCQWRGDMMALLHVPCVPAGTGNELQTSCDHLAALVAAASAHDSRCLGYGAAYAPWLEVGEENKERRLVPPDGVVAGMLALGARTAGAWTAPANIALKGIVRPAVAYGPDAAGQLLRARGNPILREPWGTVAAGAYTLAEEHDEVQHVHVRRLMCLLRRVVLQYGHEQVFEPLGPAFVRAVNANFTSVLEELYRRGAFSGGRPETAFRVDVIADFEAARCVVELRVAPAMPMVFLAVRLVLEHGRTAVEGA